NLHTLRTFSNKADHDVENVTLTIADAENCLNLFLRVLVWLNCEYNHGPKLGTIYSSEPAEARALAALYLRSVAIRAEEDPLSTLVRQRLFVRDVFQEPLVAGSADPARVDVAMLSTEDDDGATDEIIDVEQALDRGFCVPWSVARNAAPSWVLLAASGSGKSLLLRWECLVARDTCVTEEAGPVVPVRWDAVSVAAQLSGGAALHEVLRQQALGVLRSVAPRGTAPAVLEDFAERAWSEGRYRLLLDGLEGVPEERRHRFLDDVLSQAKGHATAVVTGRTIEPRALPTGSV